MTQEDKYKKSIKETKKYKNIVEIEYYQKERNELLKELDNIKKNISDIKKENNDSQIKLYNKKNKKIELEKEINKANQSTEIIEKIKKELNEINNWLEQVNTQKDETEKQKLNLLYNKEEVSKELLSIEKTIKKFYEINPTIEEVIDTNKTIQLLNEYESNYNTDQFKEKEYELLKERYINEQELIDYMLEIATKNYKINKIYYIKETNRLKRDKDTLSKLEVKKLKKYIKIYKRIIEIWEQTINKIKSNKIEHTFIEKKDKKEEIKNNKITLTIDLTNNQDAVDKIKAINKNTYNISQAVQKKLISAQEGLNEINELYNKEKNNIYEIINTYSETKKSLEEIINNIQKRTELTKLSTKKANKTISLNENDLDTISKLSQEDYNKIIIKLINIMQYEKTITELNSLIN